MNIRFIDFETSNANPYGCEIRCCVISDGKHKSYYRDGDDARWSELHHDLYKCDRLVAHNAAFDLYLLTERVGIPYHGPVFDTMLAAKHWRNDLPSYSLKSLSWWFFGDTYLPLRNLRQWFHDHGYDNDEEDEFNMMLPPENLVRPYCERDVHNTIRLYNRFEPEVRSNYAHTMDQQCIRRVMEMAARGITIDKEGLRDFKRNGRRRIKYNFSVASKELKVKRGKKPTGTALRDHLQVLGVRKFTPSGMTAADDAVLRGFKKQDRAVGAVVRIRGDQKLVSTYAQNILDACGKETFFHPGLLQSAAITRRFKARNYYSHHGPIIKGQVQNVPRGPGIRSYVIVPKRFKFVKLDLASIEPRMGANAMAAFIGFNYYCKRYREDPKFNMYLHVVENYTEHGRITKKDPIYLAYKHGCLGVQYCVGVETFHRTLVDTFELPYTLEECDHIYRTIRSKCPEFGELQRAVSSIIDKQGYIVDDFGAIYYVPAAERYKGVNYYCQGCAGNVLKWWWLELAKIMDPRDYLFNTVHDELDAAILSVGQPKLRVQSYCDVLDRLDLFELPIVAEASDLVDNWADAG